LNHHLQEFRNLEHHLRLPSLKI